MEFRRGVDTSPYKANTTFISTRLFKVSHPRAAFSQVSNIFSDKKTGLHFRFYHINLYLKLNINTGNVHLEGETTLCSFYNCSSGTTDAFTAEADGLTVTHWCHKVANSSAVNTAGKYLSCETAGDGRAGSHMREWRWTAMTDHLNK